MLEKIPGAVGEALSGLKAGCEKTASHATFADVPARLVLTSPAFAEGAELPARFTADGEGLSPPLAWSNLPAGTAALVVLVEDAGSPTPQPLVHLILWSVPPDVSEIREGALPSPGPTRDRHGARPEQLPARGVAAAGPADRPRITRIRLPDLCAPEGPDLVGVSRPRRPSQGHARAGSREGPADRILSSILMPRPRIRTSAPHRRKRALCPFHRLRIVSTSAAGNGRIGLETGPVGVDARTKRRGDADAARALAASEVGTWAWQVADDVLRCDGVAASMLGLPWSGRDRATTFAGSWNASIPRIDAGSARSSTTCAGRAGSMSRSIGRSWKPAKSVGFWRVGDPLGTRRGS